MTSLEQHGERVEALLRKVDELATRALACDGGPESTPAMLKLLSEIASHAETAISDGWIRHLSAWGIG